MTAAVTSYIPSPARKEIRAKIALHYPEAERETIWEQVQRQIRRVFLSDWRTDLGGKKNFHNGVGGTYDCIAIMCFYDVCRGCGHFIPRNGRDRRESDPAGVPEAALR